MRYSFFLPILLVSGWIRAQTSVSEMTITPQLLSTHVYALAHDSLEGRATGSSGELKAAHYVARQFERLQLRSTDDQHTARLQRYFQPYTIYRRDWGPTFFKTVSNTYHLYEHFYVNGLPHMPAQQTVGVVFGGYGIDDTAYSDYRQLDVCGKAVVIWEGEPRTTAGHYPISGTTQPSRWSDDAYAWQRKVKAAKARGATHVLIISSARGGAFRQEMLRRRVLNQRLSKTSLEPITEVFSDKSAYVISDSLAQSILSVSGSELAQWQKAADEGGMSPARILNKQLTIQSSRQDFPLDTRNVLGWLEGSEKPEEVVVISAHLDHLGKSTNGVIFNGADDDASGVSGLLAIAESFVAAQKAGHSPRRSVLFAVFTGEEMGLLGSAYYVTHPRWPLSKTVCDLNIDMIGRIDDEHAASPPYVYVLGAGRVSSRLQQLSSAATNGTLLLDNRFDHDDPQDFFSRSDHYNFARHRIPVIHYFTGLHADYHQPTDDADRILYDRQALVVRQVFRTAWAVANDVECSGVDQTAGN